MIGSSRAFGDDGKFATAFETTKELAGADLAMKAIIATRKKCVLEARERWETKRLCRFVAKKQAIQQV
jgi:hypothetical protein